MHRFLFVLIVLVAVAAATTIRVPSQQPTIQAGLNAAQSGDTVLVSPGFYKENITWPSRDGIKLIGEKGRDSTTIDGDTVGVCVTMSSSVITRATVIQGFTITKGKTTANSGSGIYCQYAGPSILDNRVTRCQGAGIHLYSYNANYVPLVKGNEISGCWKEIVGSWNYGGGIYVEASNATARPEICFNYIHDDTLRRGAWNYGVGIYCDANALIYQNVIANNVATAVSGDYGRGHGAGIFVDMSRSPVIFGNLITGNRCVTDAWNYGAGIKADLSSKPFVVGNTIAGNVCQGGSWAYGGGLYNDMRCTTRVKNNIFAGNSASSGSAIYNYVSSQNGQVNSNNNDYFNNTLSGVSMGPGDITSDPQFVTGGYRLSQAAAGQPSTSPCVNAGDTLLGVPGLNLDSLVHAWTTRTDDVPDAGVIDMGYHYVPVPATHDVAAAAIIAPTGTVDSGAVVTPACSVSNYGTYTETYTVRMKIGASYDTVASVTGHAPGTRVYVTFPVDWTATPCGTFSVSCSTELAGDARPQNDKLVDSVMVVLHDVGVAEILAPTGTYDTGAEVTPSARWQNNGSQAEDFMAWCMLADPAGTRVYTESVAVTGIAAGADTTLSFVMHNVHSDTGLWAVKCSTWCAGDIVPANDIATGSFRVGSAQPPQPGWLEKTSVPSTPSGKAVKDGGWLAEDGGYIYAAKGNKTADFYRYEVEHDSWKTLASIPDGVEAKKPGKGAIGASDAAGTIYATKGNNTQGFWKYDAGRDSWYQRKDVPLGPSNKKVKGGTDLVHHNGYIYLLKGYKNEFLKYDVANDSWTIIAPAPLGASGKDKYDKGSWLVPGLEPVLYCHKAKYHELFSYDVSKDSWTSDVLTGMPFIGQTGKKKKSKDGGSAALLNDYVYALKGGNTQEFWRYDPAVDSWLEQDTMPQFGTTGKKKKVKAGGDITATTDMLYALKGNKTLEFWRYVPSGRRLTANGSRPAGATASGVMRGESSVLRIFPNPLRAGFVTVTLAPGHDRIVGQFGSCPRLSVYDAAGRCVLQQALSMERGASGVRLDLRGVSPGIYVVKVTAGGLTGTQKLIVSY